MASQPEDISSRKGLSVIFRHVHTSWKDVSQRLGATAAETSCHRKRKDIRSFRVLDVTDLLDQGQVQFYWDASANVVCCASSTLTLSGHGHDAIGLCG